MTSPAPPAAFADAAATWNRRFEGDSYLFGREPNAWLRERTGLWQPGERVLCVADGEGRNSVWLARHGLQVQAFDIADAGVMKARRLAAEAGVDVDHQVAGIEGFAWPQGTFNGVAAVFVQFAGPAERERLFAKMVDALAPGGTLALLGYTPRQLDYRTGGPPHASHMYTQPLLRQAFAALEILELAEWDEDITEGTGHRGMSALIGLVARRRADAPLD